MLAERHEPVGRVQEAAGVSERRVVELHQGAGPLLRRVFALGVVVGLPPLGAAPLLQLFDLEQVMETPEWGPPLHEPLETEQLARDAVVARSLPPVSVVFVVLFAPRVRPLGGGPRVLLIKVVNLVATRFEVAHVNLGGLLDAGVRALLPLRVPLFVLRRPLDLACPYGCVVQVRGVAGPPRVPVVLLALRIRVRHAVLLVVGRLPPLWEPRAPLPLLPSVPPGVCAAGGLALVPWLVPAWLGPPVEEPPVGAQE